MMRSVFRHVALAVGLGGAIAAGSAAATTIVFNDFSNLTSLDLNGITAGATTGDGSVLRLTPAVHSQWGSAFGLAQINAAAFSTYFRFRITSAGGLGVSDCNGGQSGADGLVFVVQNQSSSAGGPGQAIGYQGIGQSVGVEFDTWCNALNNDPSTNHIGIDLNGNVNHGAGSPNTANVATRFDDGNIWYAWVDYDGTNIEVRANQTGIRPTAPMLSRELSGLNGTQTVAQLLGQGNAFVGFTSATGSNWGNHDILSWEYRDTFNPIDNNIAPEPASIALLSLGLFGLGFSRRRQS